MDQRRPITAYNRAQKVRALTRNIENNARFVFHATEDGHDLRGETKRLVSIALRNLKEDVEELRAAMTRPLDA